MGAAITAACGIITSGKTVLRIKGAEGFLMERHDIEMECEASKPRRSSRNLSRRVRFKRFGPDERSPQQWRGE